MIPVTLNEDNFEMYAIRHYDNPHCFGKKEFKEDVLRFRHLNRLLNWYEDGNYDKIEFILNMILNHIVIIYNLFNEAATNMLFYRVAEHHWPILIPFLLFLNRMPDVVHITATRKLIESEIVVDMHVVDMLRQFLKN